MKPGSMLRFRILFSAFLFASGILLAEEQESNPAAQKSPKPVPSSALAPVAAHESGGFL